MTKFLSLLPLPPSPIPCLPHSSPSLSLSPLSSLPSPPSSPLSSPCRLLDVQSTEGRFNHELIFYLVFEHMDLDLDQFIRQCPPPGMNELIIKVQTALVIIYYYSVLSHATIILLPSCFPPPHTENPVLNPHTYWSTTSTIQLHCCHQLMWFNPHLLLSSSSSKVDTR